MKKIIIEGMMCGHCVEVIEKNLKSIEGAGEIKVSLDEKSAFISGEIEDDLIKSAIEDEGYQVVSIENVEEYPKEEKVKKGFFSRLIRKIEKSNVEEFGEGKMHCCDSDKKDKEKN
ncbi:cation transporter [Ilyobacter sp.]|uniref:cation transporter n=1 Tax=Ilyobacter sp. TaxID=3100343 RepID=UPI0035632D88